jgi:hypothetical protein
MSNIERRISNFEVMLCAWHLSAEKPSAERYFDIRYSASGVCERLATALGHVLVAMQADTENADDTDDTDFFSCVNSTEALRAH